MYISAFAVFLAIFLVIGADGRDSSCYLASVTGPCMAYFRRYFYDSDLGRCLEFAYGGCGGNANNYMTLDECNAACLEDGELSKITDGDIHASSLADLLKRNTRQLRKRSDNWKVPSAESEEESEEFFLKREAESEESEEDIVKREASTEGSEEESDELFLKREAESEESEEDIVKREASYVVSEGEYEEDIMDIVKREVSNEESEEESGEDIFKRDVSSEETDDDAIFKREVSFEESGEDIL